MEDQDRHTIIQQQTNNNCQQFFGPVSGCVFAMPGSQVTQTSTPSSNPNTPQNPLSELENYLTYEYCKRYPQNYNAAIEKIKSSNWNDKDHARVALAFHESTIMSSKKPASFLTWYCIYCNAFNVQFHEEYTPSHLDDNKVSLDFKKYLVVSKE